MMKRILALLFLGAAPFGLRAAEAVTAAAGFAFPSVQQGGSARAIALGSTYVGIAEGSASLLWNPAGLGTLLCPEIAIHHNSAILDAIQEIAILGLPIGLGNGLGLSVNYEDNGSFDGRDSLGAVTSPYGARAFGGSLGWGFGGPAGIYMGVALKANHRDLAGTPSDSFTGDLGALWQILPQLNLGAAYTNLGPEVNNRQLAQGFRIGLSGYLGKGTANQTMAALSGESLTFGDQSVHLGLEQTFEQFLALRAGYAHNIQGPASQGVLGWTFGGGILYKSLTLDYAFVPLADLGNMQRVSLTYAFKDHCCTTATATATPSPAATASRTPSSTPTQTPTSVATPAAKAALPSEYAVMFNDKEFWYTHPSSNVEDESEALTDAGRQRLDEALKHLAENPGTSLRIFGKTKVMPDKDEPQEAEAKEIGVRRSVLVHDYLVKHAPASRKVQAIVTKGTNTLAAEGVYQVVVR